MVRIAYRRHYGVDSLRSLAGAVRRMQTVMEQEARDNSRAALDREASTGSNLASAIRARFEPLGGVELDLPPREPMREPRPVR